MKIAMAGDHAGFALKKEIKEMLEKEGHEIVDFGPFSEEGCDLPDFIYPASLAVSKGEVDRGIFIDGVGYGSAFMVSMQQFVKILSVLGWLVHIRIRMYFV